MANHATAPVSPHLQIWRWTVTMAASIFQRATGVAQYAGAILLTIWLASAAMGEQAFNTVQSLFASPLGMVVLVGYSWSISFHLINGIRFLFWDAGYGFKVKTANLTGWLAFGGSIILTAIIWAIVILTGGGN